MSIPISPLKGSRNGGGSGSNKDDKISRSRSGPLDVEKWGEPARGLAKTVVEFAKGSFYQSRVLNWLGESRIDHPLADYPDEIIPDSLRDPLRQSPIKDKLEQLKSRPQSRSKTSHSTTRKHDRRGTWSYSHSSHPSRHTGSKRNQSENQNRLYTADPLSPGNRQSNLDQVQWPTPNSTQSQFRTSRRLGTTQRSFLYIDEVQQTLPKTQAPKLPLIVDQQRKYKPNDIHYNDPYYYRKKNDVKSMAWRSGKEKNIVLCSGRTFKGIYLKNMVRENLKIKREYSQGSVTSSAARAGGSKGYSNRKKRLELLIKKDQANFFRFDISKEMMSNMHPIRSRRRRASGGVGFEKYQEHGSFYGRDLRDRRISQGVSESIGSKYGQGNYLGIVDRRPKLGILETSNLWDTQHA